MNNLNKDIFPLLKLPKDLIWLLMQPNYMDCASARNFMLSCKKVYDSAEVLFRKKCLARKCIPRGNVNPLKHCYRSGPYYNCVCKKCGVYIKPKHLRRHRQRCRGLRQCYICWKWINSKTFKNHFTSQGYQGEHVIYNHPLNDKGLYFEYFSYALNKLGLRPSILGLLEDVPSCFTS